ncbi:MAG: hypothetical protein FJY07_09785 [Bacteroidetes bacterium]|nr:hypothetical protein [Bacteroidota bacterium]
MNCIDLKKKLIFLVNGDFSSEEEKIALSHLDMCDRCRTLFEKLKTEWQDIENDKIKGEDKFFVNRVMKRIEAEESKQNSLISLPVIRIVKTVALSLISAAAILTGIILGAKFSIQFTNPAEQGYPETEAFVNEYFLDELQEENIESILFTQNKE